MARPQQNTTVALDAYGTAFDLASPVKEALGDTPLDVAHVSELLRARQLELAWTDVSIGRPPDFMGATRRAISAVLAEAGYPPSGELSLRLQDAYRRISPNAGVRDMLHEMRVIGTRVVIFSNANQAMLEESVVAAGLADLVDGVFSVSPSRVFKPHPGAYSFLRSLLNKEGRDVWLLSSNAWDIAGALAAGLRTCWWNKHAVSFPYGPLEPTRTVAGLSDAAGEIVAEVG